MERWRDNDFWPLHIGRTVAYVARGLYV